MHPDGSDPRITLRRDRKGTGFKPVPFFMTIPRRFRNGGRLRGQPPLSAPVIARRRSFIDCGRSCQRMANPEIMTFSNAAGT